MLSIAQRILASFKKKARDPATIAKQLFAELAAGMPSPEELIEEGYDPQHIVYIGVQNLAALFAESVSALDEFESFSRIVERAEEEYMPMGPPMSPITSSFFWTWALFDLRFGADQETIGSCLFELMSSMEAPSEMLTALKNYSNSRMGIYEHCGMRGDKVRLRELITGKEKLCHSGSRYAGRKRELWFVRLTPPLDKQFDYHIAITTPYVLTNASAQDWTAFLNKQLMGANDKRASLHDLLKYGSTNVDWMEFVFQAFHHDQCEAIFLAGLPDVAASLPHAPSHDEEEVETHATDDSELLVRVKFTGVQRKKIAAMCPELAVRLLLSEKNPRTIELRQSELEGISAVARKALSNAKGPQIVVLNKIIDTTDPAINPPKSRTLSPNAATIYQFKITLAGSDPPIWRRIECEDCTLAELHYLIQNAMGWENCHMHEFNIAGECYSAGPPMMEGPMDSDAFDASEFRLSELIQGKKKFRCAYIYDFGDCWEHVIELEGIAAPEARTRYPRCTDGAQACPPEDCGGLYGFYDFVEAISNRKHPDHREMKEWLGPFKPNVFDKTRATREMRM